MRTTRPWKAALAGTAATALVLSGCTGGDDDDTATQPAETVTVTSSPEPTQDAQTPTEESTPSGDGEVPAVYDGVLAAIPLAEQEAGGTAFELDDVNAGDWEVHVAVGNDDVEVQVSADGSQVLGTQPDGGLDSDDAQGLEQAGIGLQDVVRAAIVEYGGQEPVDDASISEDDGTFEWEVSFTDGTEVYLDIADGTVLRTEG